MKRESKDTATKMSDLRNGQASNGETRNNVRLEEFGAVIRTPIKNGKDTLSSQ